MSIKPLISVVIPTCDRPAEFLSMALASVLAQSLTPCEVIVVDNGKRDADVGELPVNVTLLRLPPRVGASRARNYGAAMAKGELLAFLDDDDWWDADFLFEAYKVLKQDGSSCVYGRKDKFCDGVRTRYKSPTVESLNIGVILHRNPCLGGQNLLISKKLFWKVGGFDERLLTSEDKALALEILLQGEKISVAPNAATIVREHSGERLRDAQYRKLRFLWKYKELYGLKRGVFEFINIIHKFFSQKLRSFVK